ncbi:toxin glutamine deamidase domain-containing protein [Microbispora sp. H10885]|uniref:toxin glutamine deamidase domain-containing protein n=1 Tax=Microbispora sp. H10885 TaxID=2729110 RepID=UPI002873CE87|nr:toxin glutamine deamidase domain-containing protein [Microbispora sp. H10885]
MNQEKARRHARWRLPSGVYNPVVAADGRRWRDYEQAAEAPAPSLGDRRLEVRIAALPLGADTGAVPVVPAARNGDNAGHGMSTLTGRRGGPPAVWDAVAATTPAGDTGVVADAGDPQVAVPARETIEEATGETAAETTGETAEATAGGTADAVPGGSPTGVEDTGALAPVEDDQDDDQDALTGTAEADPPCAEADLPCAGDGVVDGGATDAPEGERPVPGETDETASAGCAWPDEETDRRGHVDETAGRDEAPGDDPEEGARTASEAGPELDAVSVHGSGAGMEELADGDDFWSAVLRDETERDWLDGPDRPRRLEETRTYGRPGGLAEADPDGQASLAQAVNGRFPDPRGTWIRLINAEGPTEDAFRSNNAVDCALSVMSTWHGEPVVAARRHPEYDPSGRPLLTGETGGVARAEEWLGHRFEYVGHGRRAYVAVAQRLIFGGHGAAAVLITRWAGGGSHAWNAVNCRGEVVWIDAQRGHMAVDPPYEDVTGVFAVVVDRQGRRL